MTVNDNLGPSKNKRIECTSQDWFDAEIIEKTTAKRDKLFKHFKKSCLHVDKDYSKEARKEIQKPICTKKKGYFKRN